MSAQIPKPVVTITIEVTDDDVTHARVTCGAGRNFPEVLHGLRLAQAEIARQIEERMKCPFSKGGEG